MFNWMIVVNILLLFIMLFGLMSLSIPLVPGLVIIWVPVLIYGLIDGFSVGSGIIFGVITVLMIIGNLLDNILMGTGARQQGASWGTIILALLGGLIATIFLTPLGGFAVTLLILYLLEYMREKDSKKAYESTKSMALGCGWAVLSRMGIGFVMILLWGLWVWKF
ncbi:MAG: DUF456 domain-containing protein [Anaerolineaceae bacterium]|nr:DUF456 domain-containing protein [Anaerolineaceae bacterium]